MMKITSKLVVVFLVIGVMFCNNVDARKFQVVSKDTNFMGQKVLDPSALPSLPPMPPIPVIGGPSGALPPASMPMPPQPEYVSVTVSVGTELNTNNDGKKGVNAVTSNGVGAQLDSSTYSGSYGVGSNGARAAFAPSGSTGEASSVGVGDAYGYAGATGPNTLTYSNSGAGGGADTSATAGPSGSTATSSSYGGGSNSNYASSGP